MASQYHSRECPLFHAEVPCDARMVPHACSIERTRTTTPYKILLIEDNEQLHWSSRILLCANYGPCAEVVSDPEACSYDFDDALKLRWFPDVSLIDVNLEDAGHFDLLPDNGQTTDCERGQPTRRPAQWDGIRLFGILTQNFCDAGAILYTGWEPRDLGLDVFSESHPILRVTRKAQNEIPVVQITRDVKRLLQAMAHRYVDRVPMCERKKALEALKSGEEAPKLIILRRRMDGTSSKFETTWESLLFPLTLDHPRGLTQAHKTRAVLESYTAPSKLRLYARWAKASVFRWPDGSDSYGLPQATCRGSGREDRTDLEVLLHPDPQVIDALICDAARKTSDQLNSLRWVVCREFTSKLDAILNDCFSPALDSLKREHLENQGPSLKSCLEWSIAELRDALSERWECSSCSRECRALLGVSFYGVKARLFDAILAIRESMRENSQSHVSLEMSLRSKADDSTATCVLMVSFETATGFPNDRTLASAFVDSTDGGHRLQIAKKGLKGYCTWHAFTNRDGGGAESHDVYLPDNRIEMPEDVNATSRPLTRHVLTFELPTPKTLRVYSTAGPEDLSEWEIAETCNATVKSHSCEKA